MNRKLMLSLVSLPALALILMPVANAKSIHLPKLRLPFAKTVSPHGKSTGTSNAGAAMATMNQSLVGSTNPIQIGPPVQVPNSKPVQVTVLLDHSFNGAEPVTSNVKLPQGNWSKVVMTVTGTQSGRQFDRLMQVWAGDTEIFTGVTPEPTTQGIAWKVQKDVTDYLPILDGNQIFTTQLDNYTSSIYTGIPNVSVTLDFYPAAHNHAGDKKSAVQHVAVPQQGDDDHLFPKGVKSDIVPLQASASMTTLHPSDTFTGTVNLPNDVVGAQLRVSLIPQIGDEFWWGQLPAFREIQVSVDGKPAGVVWPNPYIYTGGVNPMLWRPITGIHTLDIPAYQVDLSPFAGMLGGKHTITMTVQGNQDYWLVSGSLFLNEAPGVTTTGSITQDTLSFPETAPSTSTNGYGSGNTMTSQTANRDYTISGTVSTNSGHWTSKVHQTMQFSNDQTNTQANYFQLVHGNQTVNSDSIISGPGLFTMDWRNTSMYTLDATDGYIQDSASSNFTLPTSVTQTMQEKTRTLQNGKSVYSSNEYETIQGYAVMQTGDASNQVALGSTTGYADYSNSLGQKYNRVIIARGGKVISDTVSGNMGQ